MASSGNLRCPQTGSSQNFPSRLPVVPLQLPFSPLESLILSPGNAYLLHPSVHLSDLSLPAPAPWSLENSNPDVGLSRATGTPKPYWGWKRRSLLGNRLTILSIQMGLETFRQLLDVLLSLTQNVVHSLLKIPHGTNESLKGPLHMFVSSHVEEGTSTCPTCQKHNSDKKCKSEAKGRL